MILHPSYLPHAPQITGVVVAKNDNGNGITSSVCFFLNGRFVRATEMPEQDTMRQNRNAAMDCAMTHKFLSGGEEE